MKTWAVTVHLLDGKKWHNSTMRYEVNQPQTAAGRALRQAKKSFPKHKRITEFVIKGTILPRLKETANDTE